ncbi:hypothetical protein [Tropicibacter oceani]|uniref:SnoaL-like domain-containing protein n=1 Tax=Tropicibacter oceani TaxID=3058420 RepID=A0ABY8QNR0_9RHOB|nr:hypothetical protein [Tropicibacter oceani]WGW05656.1 hypothetical protein QF118_08955 [Tropicibacter oceani]
MEQARQQYQDILDAMTDAMRDRNAAAFLPHIQLPMIMTTVDGTITYDDPDQVTASFDRYMNELDSRGVDQLKRICISARVDDLGVLDGYHQTSLFKGADLAIEPFTTRLKFRRGAGGGWKNFRSESGLANESWPILPDHAHQQPPQGFEGDDMKAFGLFQALLNVVTQHYLTGNVEGLHSCVAYPLEMQGRHGDTVIRNFAELRADFQLYLDEFRIHSVTDILRIVRNARFVSDTEIRGQYKTYILNKERFVVDPYESEMTLALMPDGTWRMKAVHHSLGHLNWRREEVTQ